MNKSCTNRLLIYEGTGINTTTTGGYVAIPSNISEWYVKLSYTEDSAGAITPTLRGNESKSTSNPLDIEAFGALSATGVTRQQYDTADKALLPPYLYLFITTVSGSWTVTCELWYSTVDVS